MDPFSHHTASSDPHKKHHPPSTSDLFGSAKVVAEAAKATLHHGSEKVDKSRVAGAAADLLGAASHYGKLEEKSYGKYVGKAETYLHQYQSTHSTTTTTSSGHSTTTTAAAAATETHSSSHSGGDDGHSGGGYGDYLKMAQGFMKKN